MNKSSIEKKDQIEKPVEPILAIPEQPVMQKASSIAVQFPKTNFIENPSVFNDFNSLNDDENFPIQSKKFKPVAGFKAVPTENDYVQQMIQANASKNVMGFGGQGQTAGMQTLGQGDSIKALIKSERKTRKKGKKAVKV